MGIKNVKVAKILGVVGTGLSIVSLILGNVSQKAEISEAAAEAAKEAVKEILKNG